MTRWYRDSGQLRRTILPASVTMATVGIGVAAWAVGPYVNSGSDTLGDVAPDTISGSGANLTYKALGSGTAENNLLAKTQSVGFMSRNFKQTVLDNHPGWWPTPTNVLGLDAATVVVRNNPSKMQNVVLPQNPDKQNFALPESTLSLVLSGKGALGTAAACRDPARLAALNSMSNDMGGVTLQHFYRRNDASGTSDTIRERVLTTASGTSGGRFCNGQAPGGLKGDGVTFNTNADAEDMDPIRMDCVEADDTHLATKCTYWPYNVACFVKNKISTAGDPGAPVPAGVKCTQGFVVALTQVDPGSSDVTVSIANRVFADDTNGTLGYAGREAVEQAGTTYGPTIERISNAALNVRNNAYALSRRLFLNKGDNVTDTAQQAEENKLFNWATNSSTGRNHMQGIMSKWGFITCYDDPDQIPAGYNLCADETIPAAETTMGLCTAEGKSVANGGLCCEGTTCACTVVPPATSCTCTCPLAPALVDTPCSSDNDCGTGKICVNRGGASKVCRVSCTTTPPDTICPALTPAQTCAGGSGTRKYCQ